MTLVILDNALIKNTILNFLAHVFLAQADTNLMIGNFIADFVKGKKAFSTYPLPIQNGILLHRAIDDYTDKHPSIKSSVQLLKPNQGKLASVVVDVLCDYLLIKHWKQYSEIELQDFATDIYKKLETNFDILPLKLQQRLPTMIEHNWLVRYGLIEGLNFTFGKMKNRISFPSNIEHSTQDLIKHETALSIHFNQFFPEIIQFVNQKIEMIQQKK